MIVSVWASHPSDSVSPTQTSVCTWLHSIAVSSYIISRIIQLCTISSSWWMFRFLCKATAPAFLRLMRFLYFLKKLNVRHVNWRSISILNNFTISYISQLHEFLPPKLSHFTVVFASFVQNSHRSHVVVIFHIKRVRLACTNTSSSLSIFRVCLACTNIRSSL